MGANVRKLKRPDNVEELSIGTPSSSALPLPSRISNLRHPNGVTVSPLSIKLKLPSTQPISSHPSASPPPSKTSRKRRHSSVDSEESAHGHAQSFHREEDAGYAARSDGTYRVATPRARRERQSSSTVLPTSSTTTAPEADESGMDDSLSKDFNRSARNKPLVPNGVKVEGRAVGRKRKLEDDAEEEPGHLAQDDSRPVVQQRKRRAVQTNPSTTRPPPTGPSLLILEALKHLPVSQPPASTSLGERRAIPSSALPFSTEPAVPTPTKIVSSRRITRGVDPSQTIAASRGSRSNKPWGILLPSAVTYKHDFDLDGE